MIKRTRLSKAATALASLGALLPAQAFAGAQFVIQNADASGVGFNDPTPATPVGGNTGTTRGEQRLKAFEYAASIWSQHISSSVPIVVQAEFGPLFCDTYSATLGSAGTNYVFTDFDGARLSSTWYHSALADKLAEEDLAPGEPDILAQFNSTIDSEECFGDTGWYYGFDGQSGDHLDLVPVLLHELGHGLGFSNLVNESNGQMFYNQQDIFTAFTYDERQGKYWSALTDEERVQSAKNAGFLTWRGGTVQSDVHSMLSRGMPRLNVTTGNVSRFSGLIGEAEFGPSLSTDGVSGELAIGNDAVGTGADGCETLPDLTGKVVLLQRGGCAFVDKVLNAQASGALAVLIDDTDTVEPPPEMEGSFNGLHIPSARISLRDGESLRDAAINETLTVSLGLDGETFHGATRGGYPMLFAPNPMIAGSSVSHFDVSASPNLLMEPYASADSGHGLDLTASLLQDIGWDAGSCGDGTVDSGEECDNGESNSNTEANACREDCKNASCGDGVTDSGEECDGGDSCTDQCELVDDVEAGGDENTGGTAAVGGEMAAGGEAPLEAGAGGEAKVFKGDSDDGVDDVGAESDPEEEPAKGCAVAPNAPASSSTSTSFAGLAALAAMVLGRRRRK